MPPAARQPALEDTLQQVAGSVLTAPAIEELAHRLAGNVHRLRQNKPAYPWTVQRFREWVPAQIMSVRRVTRRRSNENGAVLTFKVMAGTSCPLLIEKWRSLRWLFHSARTLGFTRRAVRGQPTAHPYAVPEQYTTLRLALLIEPTLSSRGPDFFYTQVTSGLRDWNRRQLRRRARLDGFTCREDYPATLPCHRCWRGYTSCPAGTHRADYTFAFCAGCQQADAPFDPDLKSAVCVVCYNATAFYTKEQA